MRYSGLRIGDAVSCSVDRLLNGKLRLYTQKTGTHVHCPLPEFVVKELSAIPKKNERYWFWTGNGKLETAVADWQGRLLDIFTDLKIDEFARANKITAAEARKQLQQKGGTIADDTLTASATRSPWSYCLPGFRLSAFRFFSAIPA